MKSRLILVGFVLSVLSLNTGAQTVKETTNGIICRPMFPSQSGLVQYKAWGLLNNTSDTDVWVVCPLIQAQFSNAVTQVAAVITVVNRNDYSVSGTCLFKESNVDGYVVNTFATPFLIARNSSDRTGMPLALEHFDNSVTFSCRLPRNSYIGPIFHLTAPSPP